jgi:hypothetical protein
MLAGSKRQGKERKGKERKGKKEGKLTRYLDRLGCTKESRWSLSNRSS